MSAETIIIPKLSKLDWDSQQNGLNHDQMVDQYLASGVDPKKIVDSHFRQQEALKLFSEVFKKAEIVSRQDLDWSVANQARAVVAIGGDGHFNFVSHFVRDQLIIGVNSDPLTSVGTLCNFSIFNLDQLAKSLKDPNPKIQKRTRMEAQINDYRLPFLACSDIFIGERDRLLISRYILNYRGQLEEQKSSGLIIATGSGMRGWYSGAARPFCDKLAISSMDALELRFVASEFFDNQGKVHYRFPVGEIKENESLEINSLLKDSGVISIDCLVDDNMIYRFPAGSKARVSISSQPLNTLTI